MSAVACARRGCSATVCLDDVVEARMRRTHEFFLCPFGHSNYFPKLTDEEERIKRLEKLLDAQRDFTRRASLQRAEVDESFGSCPFCDWRSHAHHSRKWLSLLRHFDKAHRELLTGQRGIGSFVWAMRQAEAGEEQSA
jgi:hypothetical protein